MDLDQGGGNQANTVALAAPPALAGFVERIWVSEWVVPPWVQRWRVVADDAPHIIWHLLDGSTRAAGQGIGVVGARSVHFDAGQAPAGDRCARGAPRTSVCR
jgi:hypothetical protein